MIFGIGLARLEAVVEAAEEAVELVPLGGGVPIAGHAAPVVASSLKVAGVATDIMGVSGRAMLAAIVAGTTDSATLADLAKGRLRTTSASNWSGP